MTLELLTAERLQPIADELQRDRLTTRLFVGGPLHGMTMTVGLSANVYSVDLDILDGANREDFEPPARVMSERLVVDYVAVKYVGPDVRGVGQLRYPLLMVESSGQFVSGELRRDFAMLALDALMRATLAKGL